MSSSGIASNTPVNPLKNGKEPFITVRDLVKVYKSPAGDFTALKHLNIEVGRGEFIAVIGKSGSGKSTFINMLTGIDRPSSGEVWIGGTPVHSLNETQMAKWRGMNLGVVFQFFQLLPTLTLVENVILAMELNNHYSKRERRERAMHLLELVEMAPQAHKLPAAVSGGQQQRVAIARALANDPGLIVADEPTGSLDSKTADKIFQLFEKLVADGKTILIVTHDDNQARRANRTILISDGEIVNEYLVQALSVLSQDQLVEVKRHVEPHVYPANANIFRQGEVGDKFYIITHGTVDILIDQPDGSQLTVNHLKEGQYFGEMAILGNGLRTASVKASTDTEVGVVALDRPTFNHLIDESQSLRDELGRIVEKRLIVEKMEVLSRLSQEQLLSLTRDLSIQAFQPGQVIIKQGTIGRSFFIIVEGSVDVVVELHDGVEGIVNQLYAGQYFGEAALMDNQRRNATVRASARGPVKVVELDHAAFDKLVSSSDAFRQDVVQANIVRHDGLNAVTQNAAQNAAHNTAHNTAHTTPDKAL